MPARATAVWEPYGSTSIGPKAIDRAFSANFLDDLDVDALSEKFRVTR